MKKKKKKKEREYQGAAIDLLQNLGDERDLDASGCSVCGSHTYTHYVLFCLD